MLLLLLFGAVSCYAQYDDYFKYVIGQPTIFKPVKGEFIPGQSKMIVDGKEKRKVNYSYRFNNPLIQLEYFYPQSPKDSSCSYFVLNNARINLKGRYDHDFACDLDVTSFKMYQGLFNHRNYILLTGINTGSGTFTTSIICHLFDVTDKNAIKYYPLWSKYGSSACLGDFNKDGRLDFLKVRYFKGNQSKLRASIESLNNSFFEPFKEDIYFIDIQLTDNGDYKVLHKKWFK